MLVPSPWCAACLIPRNTLLPTGYHTKFGRSGSTYNRIGRNPKNFWGCWDPTPLSWGVSDPLETCPPHCKFSHSRSNGWCVIMEILLRSLTLHVLPFKVIGTDTDRSVTYDFLLVFHSNYGPISYSFRDKSNNCKILPPQCI